MQLLGYYETEKKVKKSMSAILFVCLFFSTVLHGSLKVKLTVDIARWTIGKQAIIEELDEVLCIAGAIGVQVSRTPNFGCCFDIALLLFRSVNSEEIALIDLFIIHQNRRILTRHGVIPCGLVDPSAAAKDKKEIKEIIMENFMMTTSW